MEKVVNMRIARDFTVVLVMALALAGTSQAKTPLIDFQTGESLVTNIKAHRLGDLITILIIEESSAKAQAKTKTDNKSESSGGPGLGVLNFLKPWDMTVENKYQGDGDTQRRGSLRAEITARITEVLHKIGRASCRERV